VTNLSDDVTEADLQELFRPFGPVSRVFVAVDRATGENRGFAFVNYVYRYVYQCELSIRHERRQKKEFLLVSAWAHHLPGKHHHLFPVAHFLMSASLVHAVFAWQ